MYRIGTKFGGKKDVAHRGNFSRNYTILLLTIKIPLMGINKTQRKVGIYYLCPGKQQIAVSFYWILKFLL